MKTTSVIVSIGTENKAKIRAVQMALDLIWPQENDNTTTSGAHQVRGVKVESCVRAQPLSDDETLEGADHRARKALESDPSADYGVGIEGGLVRANDTWFECGWVVVVSRSGQVGRASTCRFEMPDIVTRPILEEGKELAEVMDELTKMKDIRSNEGAMGIYSNMLLHRDHVVSHAVIFAFSKFIVKPELWYGPNVVATSASAAN
eukprot:gene2334-2648_t